MRLIFHSMVYVRKSKLNVKSHRFSSIFNLVFSKKKIFFFLSFSGTTAAAHGGSQARGLIRATAAGPHGATAMLLSLQPTPQLTATPHR